MYRDPQQRHVQATQARSADEGLRLRSMTSAPAHERKYGGQAQSATQSAPIPVTMTPRQREAEHPRTINLATSTEAALCLHEHSSSTTPWSLLEWRVGTHTSTDAADITPIAQRAITPFPAKRATRTMVATRAICASHTQMGMKRACATTKGRNPRRDSAPPRARESSATMAETSASMASSPTGSTCRW